MLHSPHDPQTRHLSLRHSTPQALARPRPPPRTSERPDALPRLRAATRLGDHAPTTQPRAGPRGASRTRRARHHRQRPRHMPPMQPEARLQTHPTPAQADPGPHRRRYPMVNVTYPRPITDWMGRTIRTEVPETPGTHTPECGEHHTREQYLPLDKGRYPLPQQPGTPRGPSEIPPWGTRNRP